MNYKRKYLKYRKKISMLQAQHGGALFKISGPSGIHIIKIPQLKKTIYLFRDIHKSTKGMCLENNVECISTEDCYIVEDLIRVIIYRNIHRNLERTYNNRYLDIFVEKGYAPNRMMYEAAILDRLQSVKNLFINLLSTIKGTDVSKIFPPSSKHHGPLTDVISRNYECLRHGEAIGESEGECTLHKVEKEVIRKDCLPFTRFQKMDLRESNLLYFAKIKKFYKIVIREIKKINSITILQDFLTSYFTADQNNEFNFINVIKYFAELYNISDTGATSDTEIHNRIQSIIYDDCKIKKQLENVVIDQDKLKKITEEVSSSIKRDNIQSLIPKYKAFVEQYKLLMTRDLDKIISDIPKTKGECLNFFTDILEKCEPFIAGIGKLMMDVYTTFRMFRKFVDGQEPQNIIVYAGSAHISFYIKVIDKLNNYFDTISIEKVVDKDHGIFNLDALSRCTPIFIYKGKILDMNV